MLLEELDRLTASALTPGGHRFRVSEVVLVHDSGPDRSDLAIRALAERYGYVRPVWLARNFGQHAATLAGMASTSADWIVTMDEDGQHDPAAIAAMLDAALATASPLVYAAPTNAAPHTRLPQASPAAWRTASRGSWARAACSTSTASGWCSARSGAGWPPTAARASTWTWRSPGSSTARRSAR